MSAQQVMDEMVVMGRIVAPYGVYGWLKVQPDTEAVDGLLAYPDWWLGRAGQWQKFVVEVAKVHGKLLLVKLIGVSDRDAAFALRGSQVSVPRVQLPATDEDEYYWTDLIGLRVRNLQNVDFGQVVELLETGANDVLVVQHTAVAEGTKEQPVVRERLIPFIEQVVLNIDLAAGNLQVDWEAEF